MPRLGSRLQITQGSLASKINVTAVVVTQRWADTIRQGTFARRSLQRAKGVQPVFSRARHRSCHTIAMLGMESLAARLCRVW